jgi:hypothetical protein
MDNYEECTQKSLDSPLLFLPPEIFDTQFVGFSIYPDSTWVSDLSLSDLLRKKVMMS